MSKEIVDTFRDKIRPLCDGKQEQIAKAAGISRVFLNRILRGKAVPSLDIAESIAVASGLSLSDAITCDSK
jgi:transcriptional regulator with XRE-family HTH domain